jgi:hypothetical protein
LDFEDLVKCLRLIKWRAELDVVVVPPKPAWLIPRACRYVWIRLAKALVVIAVEEDIVVLGTVVRV